MVIDTLWTAGIYISKPEKRMAVTGNQSSSSFSRW